MRCLASLIGIIVLVVSSSASAQPSSPWLGARVVTRSSDIALRLGSSTIPPAGDLHPAYTVEYVQGNWLWVTSGDVFGWLTIRDVVPLDQAVSYFSRIIQRDPTNAAAYANRGSAWFKLKQYDRTIEDLTQALHFQPVTLEYYNKRGLAWLAKREFSIAIMDFTDALQINVDYALSYDYRGIARMRNGDLAGAIEDFKEALRIDDTSPTVNLHRGNAWWLVGDYRVAYAHYEEAIRLGPTNPVAYLRRAATLRKFAQYERALADYYDALRLDPNSAQALNDRAWLQATCPEAQIRDGKQAVAEATRACEATEWHNAEYLVTLGAAYAEIGDYQAAIKHETDALKLAPGDEVFQAAGQARLALYKANMPYRTP